MKIKSILEGKEEVEPTLWEGLWLRRRRPLWHHRAVVRTLKWQLIVGLPLLANAGDVSPASRGTRRQNKQTAATHLIKTPGLQWRPLKSLKTDIFGVTAPPGWPAFADPSQSSV